MKKIWSLLLIWGFAGMSAADDQATQFSCTNGEQLFVLNVNTQTNAVEKIMFFDGEYSWTAVEASAQRLNYAINMEGHSAQLNGQATKAVFEFSLPEHRPVKLIQVGGYYTPVLRTVPFTFLLNLKHKSTITTEHILSCTGL